MRCSRLVWILGALIAVDRAALAQPADGEPAEPPPSTQPNPPPVPPAAATTGTISGIVESPDLDAPLAGATVTIIGTTKTVTTDDEGKFTFTVPRGGYKLRADFAGFKSEEKLVTVLVNATASLDFRLATAALLAETIVVVGSRTPRTNVETVVPVDVITAEDIGRSGRTETGHILTTLAPSYNGQPQTVADGTDHVQPASLRGLGPDQVLVLINGKRRHKSALLNVNGTFGRGTVGTDLDAIASGSIKRIEILRDGAAEQYGSDAIAGVINIVTKDTTDAVDISSEVGVTGSRDGAEFTSSANYGWKLGERGFINLTGQFIQRDPTNRSGAYTGPVYSTDTAIDNQMLATNHLTREDFKMRVGEAGATVGIGGFNLELPFSDTGRFYAFGDVSYRRGDAGGFYRFPYQQSQNVPEFYPNGFLPLIRTDLADQAITIGLRQQTGKWNVDASITRGVSSFRFDIDNSVNASLGTNSPTNFDAGTLSSGETVSNLDLIRRLDTEGVVKSLSFVLGSELRVENYQITRGDEASYVNGGATFGNPAQPKLPGAQVFPGFQPSNEVDRTRDNIGVYAGLESELTKQLAIDAGGRYEAYSDFGQSLIGKIAARYRIIDEVSVRAGAGTGFRAPSLQQLWFSNVSTQFLTNSAGQLQPEQVLTSNNASPITRAFGIPQLHEEKSINASAGITVRPFENFSITADGYYIHIDGRIVLTSQFTTQNPIVAQILSAFPSVSQAQFFANAVDTDTKGLDVVADYAAELGVGTLTLTAAANFTQTKVANVNIPQSLIDAFGGESDQLKTFFFGRLSTNRLETSVPQQKGFLAARYSFAGLTGLVRADYYGKVRYRPDNPADDEVFGAKVLFDLDVGYQVNKTLRLGIGADNVLNTFPDKQVKPDNISMGRLIYSRDVTQFGSNGGFYYGKLELTF